MKCCRTCINFNDNLSSTHQEPCSLLTIAVKIDTQWIYNKDYCSKYANKK